MSYVYLLTNPSISRMVKVGMTTGHPDKRARELHSTGVPTPFEVAAMWEVPENQLRSYERKAHEALEKYRVSANREFFQVDPEEAIEILGGVIPSLEKIREERENQERLKEQRRIEAARRAEERRQQKLLAGRQKLESKKEEIERELHELDMRINKANEALSKPESSFAGLNAFFIKLLFFPLRYPWLVFPAVIFAFHRGPISEIFILMIATPFIAMILMPILIPVLKLNIAVAKAFGPTHKEVKEELEKAYKDKEELIKELSRVEDGLG